jgi:hypothetical protein
MSKPHSYIAIQGAFSVRSCVCLLLLCTACVGQTPAVKYETEHAQDLKSSPREITLNVNTLEPRSSYHISQLIPFKLTFSSQRSQFYTAELASGGSVAGVNDDFVILGPGFSKPLHSMPILNTGVVCCESNWHYVGRRPVTATAYLNLKETWRFLKARGQDVPDLIPGDYCIWIRTRRVRRGLPSSSFHDRYLTAGDVVVTSRNVVNFKILAGTRDAERGTPSPLVYQNNGVAATTASKS